MKYLFTGFILLFLISSSATSQVITTERSKSVERQAGDTTYTESTIISNSEDITPRFNMIVVNPLKFLLFYNLSYFHNINNKIIIGGGIQMPTIRGIDGFGLNAEIRYHPTGKMMKGFYIAPNISYNNIKSGDVKISPFSLGVLLGWQWFPGDQFAMGLGVGIDYYWGNITGSDNDISKYNGTVPALRFDIGYAW